MRLFDPFRGNPDLLVSSAGGVRGGGAARRDR
jgi:hypothetical protein